MQAVILAAGRGERMRPLTDKTPKPMLRLLNKPILNYTFRALPNEIDEVILVVGYKQNQIKSYFKNEFLGKKVKYVNSPIVGTGGALHYAKDVLKRRFMVLMGDDLYEKKDLQDCLKNDWSLLVAQAKGREHKRLGKIELDENNNFKSISGSEDIFDDEVRFLNCGAYVLKTDFFKYPLVKLKKSQETGLPQTLVKAAKDYDVKVVRASSWFPVCWPDDLVKAEEFLKKRNENT